MTSILAPAALGIFAAVISLLPRALHGFFPHLVWGTAGAVLVVAVLVAAVRFRVGRKKEGIGDYAGFPDLFVHVHSPGNPDAKPGVWALRSVISATLSIFGMWTGPEGAAIEGVKSASLARGASGSRWSEGHRRQDVSMAVSAGVSAAFLAPLAAVVLPIELGLGGNAMGALISALSAFVATHYLLAQDWMPVETIEFARLSFRIGVHRDWLVLAAVTIVAGTAAAAFSRFVVFARESLLDLLRTKAWMRTLAAGLMLFLLVMMSRSESGNAFDLFARTLGPRGEVGEVLLAAGFSAVGLCLMLVGFGSAGALWPLFAIGAALGFSLDHAGSSWLPGFAPFAPLVAAAAFLGAVIGAPLAAALMAFGLSQDYSVIAPCLVASLGASAIRRGLRTPGLFQLELEIRGLKLQQGRSLDVLNRVPIRDAMVVDHATIPENAPVATVRALMSSGRYPFLPVTDIQGRYVGLLSFDRVETAWQSSDSTSSNSQLPDLLEAKDLLYRSRTKVPSVLAGEPLSNATALLEHYPCLAVVDDGRRVLGLLFGHNVRLAYDREAARKLRP